MHIAMDGREALSEKRTGKGQWARGFLYELKKRDLSLTLLSSSHLKTIFRLLHIKPDLYLSPTSYIIPAIMGWWLPCAIVVHDLIAFQSKPHDIKAQWIERLTLPLALTFSRYIFTVSEATKRNLLERFPWLNVHKVSVIYAGPSLQHTLCKHSNVQQIVCIGTLCPRKNQQKLIDAFIQISTKFPHTKLILAGSRGWHDETIVKKSQSTPGVTWLGHVSDADYEELFKSATIFALPSFEEGFGLAVLDAMTMGIPILTSNCGSLKEIAGDAAVFVDPSRTDSIANGLERLLRDANFRSELSQKGKSQAQKFSWKNTVDLFLQSLNDDSNSPLPAGED